MLRWVAMALSIGAAPLPPVASPGPAPMLTARDCGDLLARNGIRHAGLVFVDCRYLPARQGKPLEATYHVSGRHAAAVEHVLIAATGMTPLVRICCQWETRPVYRIDASGIGFSIVMVSDETIVASRADWPRIGAFAVVVQTFTEQI